MASFTDLIVSRIRSRQQEFLAALSSEPVDDVEEQLASGVRSLWHALDNVPATNESQSLATGPAAAVDGSRAVRALNSGADWIVAQALLLGPYGPLTVADTLLARGEIERPVVDRCAALLMRSLELTLALKYVQSSTGNLLLLDGSLYAELPHLLYALSISGYEDMPLVVLQRYLDLFDHCQEQGVLLLGLAKSARSAVLGRVIMHPEFKSLRPDGAADQAATGASNSASYADPVMQPSGSRVAIPGCNGVPTDAELLHRWAHGAGFTNPVLLGWSSFGHRISPVVNDPTALAGQFPDGQLSRGERRAVLERLRDAPAIATFYLRLAPGEDAIRVDVPASAFDGNNQRLLDFSHKVLPHQAALPVVQWLRDGYGGISVYNAALYVVDREVRLHAEMMDRVYLSVLRRQLGVPIQYDRSTRRFLR
jgi:hypothetical protein